jgi:hypothetical protein
MGVPVTATVAVAPAGTQTVVPLIMTPVSTPAATATVFRSAATMVAPSMNHAASGGLRLTGPRCARAISANGRAGHSGLGAASRMSFAATRLDILRGFQLHPRAVTMAGGAVEPIARGACIYEALAKRACAMLRWAVLSHDDVSATVSYTLPTSLYSSSGSTAMVAAMAVADRIASEKVRSVVRAGRAADRGRRRANGRFGPLRSFQSSRRSGCTSKPGRFGTR